jgi:uncharacterized protein (UPF0335 family)
MKGDKMEIVNVDQEIKKEMKKGITRILSLEAEIKGLQEDKKAVKKEMKENGVDITVANKVLALLKRAKKESLDTKFKAAYEIFEEFKDDDNIETILGNIFEEKIK